MFRKCTLAIVFLAVISCNNNTHKNEKIKASQWLLGKWTSQSEEGILEETWKSLNDSTFEGTSYFIKGKDTLHNETIVLQQNGDNLIYNAKVSGQNEDEAIPFVLTATTDKKLLFENPKHDYPKKISYTLFKKDSLVAEISGIQLGKQTSEKFGMKKTQ
ncbi:DUF6265 family protein [Flavobacterium sp. RSSA_27]|uniref:DUF6265 family protein n=1 Tax=Flavobacterium sp. RSSA_27 TaxID=3447667 RepID=UPI003F3D62C5